MPRRKPPYIARHQAARKLSSFPQRETRLQAVDAAQARLLLRMREEAARYARYFHTKGFDPLTASTTSMVDSDARTSADIPNPP